MASCLGEENTVTEEKKNTHNKMEPQDAVTYGFQGETAVAPVTYWNSGSKVLLACIVIV